MLSLIPLRTSDAATSRFVYSVRSHPEVVPHLFGPPPVNWNRHDAWIRRHVDQHERMIYVIEHDEEPIGYCQAVWNEGELELGFVIHPDFQCQGFGNEAVWAWSAFASRFQVELQLAVKENNIRAKGIYDQAGFIHDRSSDGVMYLRRQSIDHARLIYVGHAGFQLEYQGIRLLCDPWFNPAFYDSWFPSPSNEHVKPLLDSPTHIYISHAHEDHFDERFLRTLSKDTIAICPWWMGTRLRELGFNNIHVIQNKWQEKLADGFGVILFTDERKHDSALYIEVAGQRILNLNDCHLPMDQLPHADVLFCQFSGAFHYPHCYDFSREEQAKKVAEVRARYIADLTARAKATGAKLYIPSSGPPRLSDPSLNRYDSIFYTWNLVEEDDEFPRMPRSRTLSRRRALTRRAYFARSYPSMDGEASSLSKNRDTVRELLQLSQF